MPPTIKDMDTKETSSIKLEDCDSKSPFNINFIQAKSEGTVPENMRAEILNSIKNGFKSGYRGSGFHQRDFSSTLKPEDEKIAFEAMKTEIEKGNCIGPFDDCPFPNSWCDKQAIICKMFVKDKHKFIQDGKKRLIQRPSPSARFERIHFEL